MGKQESGDVGHLCDVAAVAGRLLQERNRRGDVAAWSGERSTRADEESSTFIRGMLGQYYPGVPILDGMENQEIGLFGTLFIVDPVDGTGNYLMKGEKKMSGDPFWGVSIALVKEGVTSIGVVDLPDLDVHLHATLGQQLAPEMGVSCTTRLRGAHVWSDTGFVTDVEKSLDVIRRLLKAGVCFQSRRCSVAQICWVALGLIDAFVHPCPQPQDIAAACLIAEIAGGRVTDMQGTPWNPFSKSIVVSNGPVHDELLEALNE